MASSILHPTKRVSFRKAARLLRQGGRLAISDIVTEEPLPEASSAMLISGLPVLAGQRQQTDYRSVIEAAGLRVEVFEKIRSTSSFPIGRRVRPPSGRKERVDSRTQALTRGNREMTSLSPHPSPYRK